MRQAVQHATVISLDNSKKYR